MFGKLQVMLCLGFLWLFLFSIPVGRGKNLFDVAHFYIVDTTPVHWIVQKFNSAIDVTGGTARDTADSVIEGIDDKLSKADSALHSQE